MTSLRESPLKANKIARTDDLDMFTQILDISGEVQTYLAKKMQQENANKLQNKRTMLRRKVTRTVSIGDSLMLTKRSSTMTAKKAQVKNEKEPDELDLSLKNVANGVSIPGPENETAALEEEPKVYPYQNKAYWSLPANVRNAVDLSHQKQKNSDFYNRLKVLNNQISIYRILFYSKAPKYEQQFQERKQRIEYEMKNQRRDIDKQGSMAKRMKFQARAAAGPTVYIKEDTLQKNLGLENLKVPIPVLIPEAEVNNIIREQIRMPEKAELSKGARKRRSTIAIEENYSFGAKLRAGMMDLDSPKQKKVEFQGKVEVDDIDQLDKSIQDEKSNSEKSSSSSASASSESSKSKAKHRQTGKSSALSPQRLLSPVDEIVEVGRKLRFESARSSFQASTSSFNLKSILKQKKKESIYKSGNSSQFLSGLLNQIDKQLQDINDEMAKEKSKTSLGMKKMSSSYFNNSRRMFSLTELKVNNDQSQESLKISEQYEIVPESDEEKNKMQNFKSPKLQQTSQMRSAQQSIKSVYNNQNLDFSFLNKKNKRQKQQKLINFRSQQTKNQNITIGKSRNNDPKTEVGDLKVPTTRFQQMLNNEQTNTISDYHESPMVAARATNQVTRGNQKVMAQVLQDSRFDIGFSKRIDQQRNIEFMQMTRQSFVDRPDLKALESFHKRKLSVPVQSNRPSPRGHRPAATFLNGQLSKLNIMNTPYKQKLGPNNNMKLSTTLPQVTNPGMDIFEQNAMHTPKVVNMQLPPLN